MMKHRTVRELTGEIWAEVQQSQGHDPSSPFHGVSNVCLQAYVDITLGVLARHVGALIENDGDLPVEPLPKTGD